jgi:hypothetical protein
MKLKFEFDTMGNCKGINILDMTSTDLVNIKIAIHQVIESEKEELIVRQSDLIKKWNDNAPDDVIKKSKETVEYTANTLKAYERIMRILSE